MNQQLGRGGPKRSSPFSPRIRKASAMAAVTIAFLAIQMAAEPDQGINARNLAREVIWNELWAQTHNHNLWSHRELTRSDSKELLFQYFQTKEGTIRRLLAVNGHPLDAPQRQAENERIQRVIRSPEVVREDQKKEEADARRERSFLRLFPEAFLYREVGRQGDLVTLRFTPNPLFHPPNDMAKVLHSLEGTMVVNAKEKRLVSIKGRLMTEVRFWGGLLGYLQQGGTFSVSMENVAPGDWELKSLVIKMKGKALLFKTIGVQEDERCSSYTPVPPDATLAQAAESLLKSATS